MNNHVNAVAEQLAGELVKRGIKPSRALKEVVRVLPTAFGGFNRIKQSLGLV